MTSIKLNTKAVIRYGIGFLKYAIPIVIIWWLVSRIDAEQLALLKNQPKNWLLLTGAFTLTFTVVCITFVRWYFLVRALGIPFRLRDALRLSFLGYMLNFVSFGAVGGDLFKAIFIAREQPGRRTEAVATVLLDRVIGLYALLLVTSITFLLVEIPVGYAALVWIKGLTFILTAVGTVGVVAVLFIPGFTSGRIVDFFAGLPKIGPLFRRLIDGVRMYRDQKGMMIVIGVMSLGVHAGLAVALYLAACGLYPTVPSLGEHFVIVPLANVAGAIGPAGGLGTFEYAIDRLYDWVPADPDTKISGIVIAIAYRIMQIAIISIGIVYYWTSRREVRELLKNAQHEQA